MPKKLKPTYKQKCTGCELCVFEVQRQLNKVGLAGALLRIFRNRDESKKTVFSIDLDPRVHSLMMDKIKEICPNNVFEIVEEEDDTN